MHDMVFAGKIVACLKERLGGLAGASRRITVNVALGPFTHVTAESLRAAFQALVENKDFKDVALNVKKKQAAIKCKKCGAVTRISSPAFACPECGSADFDIKNSEEFSVESIEIDSNK